MVVPAQVENWEAVQVVNRIRERERTSITSLKRTQKARRKMSDNKPTITAEQHAEQIRKKTEELKKARDAIPPEPEPLLPRRVTLVNKEGGTIELHFKVCDDLSERKPKFAEMLAGEDNSQKRVDVDDEVFEEVYEYCYARLALGPAGLDQKYPKPGAVVQDMSNWQPPWKRVKDETHPETDPVAAPEAAPVA